MKEKYLCWRIAWSISSEIFPELCWAFGDGLDDNGDNDGEGDDFEGDDKIVANGDNNQDDDSAKVEMSFDWDSTKIRIKTTQFWKSFDLISTFQKNQDITKCSTQFRKYFRWYWPSYSST